MATTTPTRPAPGTPPRRRRTSVLVVLAVLGVLAVLSAFGAAFRTAPSDGPPGTPPPTVDSVGRIDGSTALIALLARGDRISAYVCDGNAALGERFSGTLVGNRAALRSADGAQLTVDLTAGGATGTFTPAGATAAQTFRTSPSTGTAGWYSAEAANGAATASWVVLADGTQTGVSTGGEDRPKHRRKHRAPHLQLRPSGVSPTAAGTTAQPDDGSESPAGEGGPVRETLDVPSPDDGSESPAGEGGPVRETLDVPSPDDGSGSLLDEGVQCVKLVNGVCAVRGSIDPVELDGGTTAQPSRVDGPLPILSADPQRGLAGN